MTTPYIVGFSDSVHDRGVCLFRGAEPVVAIEEERLTRQKHAIDFGEHDLRDPAAFRKLGLDQGHGDEHTARMRPLVDYCLGVEGIASEDVNLWIGNSLHAAFPLHGRAVYVNHHRAHAASAYFGSPFDEAAVLVVDGYGDQLTGDSYETASVYVGEGDALRDVHRVGGAMNGLHLSNSAGILYRMGTLLGGFGIVDEGKLMGLAAYGTPRFLQRIREHVEFGDRSVSIDNEAIWQDFVGSAPAASDLDRRADIAASFQAAVEEIMLFYAQVAQQLTGSRRLCMAGGVALNCVANQRILDSGIFDQVFVFPAAADNGVSFGAAYLGAHEVYGLARTGGLRSASFGRAYSRSEVSEALTKLDITATIVELDDDAMTSRIAACLAEGELVMWFQGGSEIGPRALGNRSIFADPRIADLREYINTAVKSRERFRPLAPMVLQEECSTWFDSGPSPFMLFSPPAKTKTRELAPAVVHVDGTARLQTVASEANARVHLLLSKFHDLAGIPILLNTSFNIRGEPIVETPQDAVAAFAESPVRVMCLDTFYVEKDLSSR